MRRCFSPLCEGNIVLCTGNSVCSETRISPTLLPLKITLHTVNLYITTNALRMSLDEQRGKHKHDQTIAWMLAWFTTALQPLPLSYLPWLQIFPCVLMLRYIILILSNIYGTRRSLGNAYLNQYTGDWYLTWHQWCRQWEVVITCQRQQLITKHTHQSYYGTSDYRNRTTQHYARVTHFYHNVFRYVAIRFCISLHLRPIL
jgi:hypothetical protein